MMKNDKINTDKVAHKPRNNKIMGFMIGKVAAISTRNLFLVHQIHDFLDPQRMNGMSDNQNYKRKIETKHLKKIYSYYLMEDYTMT